MCSRHREWTVTAPMSQCRVTATAWRFIMAAMTSRSRASSFAPCRVSGPRRSEEHTSELQSLMRISYAVFCLKKKNYTILTSYDTDVHYTDHDTEELINHAHILHIATQ